MSPSSHSTPETLTIRVANVTVTLPVYRSEADTRRLVALVEERMGEIAAQGGRFDSQAFAIAAAYSFAIELDQARITAEQDAQAISQRLEALTQAIELVARDMSKTLED